MIILMGAAFKNNLLIFDTITVKAIIPFIAEIINIAKIKYLNDCPTCGKLPFEIDSVDITTIALT